MGKGVSEFGKFTTWLWVLHLTQGMISIIQQENFRVEPKFIFLKKKKMLEFIETLGSRTINWKKNFSLKTFKNTYCQVIAFPERNLFGISMLPALFSGD